MAGASRRSDSLARSLRRAGRLERGLLGRGAGVRGARGSTELARGARPRRAGRAHARRAPPTRPPTCCRSCSAPASARTTSTAARACVTRRPRRRCATSLGDGRGDRLLRRHRARATHRASSARTLPRPTPCSARASQQAVRRGARLLVIDPRRIELADARGRMAAAPPGHERRAAERARGALCSSSAACDLADIARRVDGLAELRAELLAVAARGRRADRPASRPASCARAAELHRRARADSLRDGPRHLGADPGNGVACARSATSRCSRAASAAPARVCCRCADRTTCRATPTWALRPTLSPATSRSASRRRASRARGAVARAAAGAAGPDDSQSCSRRRGAAVAARALDPGRGRRAERARPDAGHRGARAARASWSSRSSSRPRRPASRTWCCPPPAASSRTAPSRTPSGASSACARRQRRRARRGRTGK